MSFNISAPGGFNFDELLTQLNKVEGDEKKNEAEKNKIKENILKSTAGLFPGYKSTSGSKPSIEHLRQIITFSNMAGPYYIEKISKYFSEKFKNIHSLVLSSEIDTDILLPSEFPKIRWDFKKVEHNSENNLPTNNLNQHFTEEPVVDSVLNYSSFAKVEPSSKKVLPYYQNSFKEEVFGDVVQTNKIEALWPNGFHTGKSYQQLLEVEAIIFEIVLMRENPGGKSSSAWFSKDENKPLIKRSKHLLEIDEWTENTIISLAEFFDHITKVLDVNTSAGNTVGQQYLSYFSFLLYTAMACSDHQTEMLKAVAEAKIEAVNEATTTLSSAKRALTTAKKNIESAKLKSAQDLATAERKVEIATENIRKAETEVKISNNAENEPERYGLLSSNYLTKREIGKENYYLSLVSPKKPPTQISGKSTIKKLRRDTLAHVRFLTVLLHTEQDSFLKHFATFIWALQNSTVFPLLFKTQK